jgi:hypothetical protein
MTLFAWIAMPIVIMTLIFVHRWPSHSWLPLAAGFLFALPVAVFILLAKAVGLQPIWNNPISLLLSVGLVDFFVPLWLALWLHTWQQRLGQWPDNISIFWFAGYFTGMAFITALYINHMQMQHQMFFLPLSYVAHTFLLGSMWATHYKGKSVRAFLYSLLPSFASYLSLSQRPILATFFFAGYLLIVAFTLMMWQKPLHTARGNQR